MPKCIDDDIESIFAAALSFHNPGPVHRVGGSGAGHTRVHAQCYPLLGRHRGAKAIGDPIGANRTLRHAKTGYDIAGIGNRVEFGPRQWDGAGVGSVAQIIASVRMFPDEVTDSVVIAVRMVGLDDRLRVNQDHVILPGHLSR